MMVNPDEITFPVSLEDVLAIQSDAVGRELYPEEKAFFAQVVTLANEVYKNAACGDVAAVEDTIAFVNSLPEDSDTDRHLRGLCRGWVELACKKGLHKLRMKTLLNDLRES